MSGGRWLRERGLGLRWQILVTLALLFVVTIVLVSTAMLGVTQRAIVRQAQRNAETQAEVASTTMAAALDVGASFDAPRNVETMQRLCRLFGGPYAGGRVVVFERRMARWMPITSHPEGIGVDPLPDVEVGVRLDAKEIVSAVQTSEGVQQLDVLAPIIVGDATIAAVRLEIPLYDVQRLIAAAQQAIVLYVLLDAFLLFVIGYFVLTRGLVRPISVISAATERVADGDFDTRLPIVARNELGALARNFERMVERLQDGREALRSRLDELARANEQLEAAQQEVVRTEKLATVGTLAAGIAHEIGNPLAAIIGLLEVLHDREGLDDETVDDLIARIEGEIERINHIVRELLDYARVKDDERGPVDVREPLQQAIGLAAHHPRAKKIRVVTAFAPEAPLVRIGEGRLVQVMLNLLVNAGDALGPGGGTVTIRTSTSEPQSSSFAAGMIGVRIDVSDDGPGIDPALLDRIFDPFVTSKAPGEGTGLGLAICERIVTNAGGRMTVTSEPGGGATFTLWLPAASLAEQLLA